MKKLISFFSRLRIVPRGTLTNSACIIPFSAMFYFSYQVTGEKSFCVQLDFLTFACAFVFYMESISEIDETYQNL